VDFPTLTSHTPLPVDGHERTPPAWAPPTVRAVCLDIDDTLVDFTSGERHALIRLLDRTDIWPLWESVTAAHVRMVVAGELAYDDMHQRRTAAFLTELGFVAEDRAVVEFERRRRKLARLGWRLFPDVLLCLDWLSAAGVRIAAVTNASGRHQHRKLGSLGIAQYFDVVAVAGELGVSKPDPLMFERVCEQLGCSTGETVHVGDKLETDARGAAAAGVAGVWLCRAANDHTAVSDVYVVDGLDRLPELLVSEFARVGVPAPR